MKPRPVVLALTTLTTLALGLTACSNSASTSTDDGATRTSSNGLVDTSNCLDPSAATKKITGTIKVGWSAALSGPFAAAIASDFEGLKARFDYQNAHGGIDGVKIDLIETDDAFDPARTKTNVTEMIDKDHVSVLGVAGDAQIAAVIDDQTDQCIPMLNTGASSPTYRDFAKYPWTTESLPSGAGGAAFQAGIIKDQVPDAKVGILANPTASGEQLASDFKTAAKQAGIDVVSTTPLTGNLTVALTSLQQAKANVVVVAGIVSDCLAVSKALGQVSFKPSLVVQGNTCTDGPTVYAPAGSAANGQIVGVYMKDPSNPAFGDDAGVKDYLAAVEGKVKDPANAYTVDGWVKGDLTVDAMLKAAKMPGGLSRASIMTAAQNQDYAAPMYLDGIKFEATPTKFTGVSAMQAMKWDAAKQSFDLLGSPVPIG